MEELPSQSNTTTTSTATTAIGSVTKSTAEQMAATKESSEVSFNC